LSHASTRISLIFFLAVNMRHLFGVLFLLSLSFQLCLSATTDEWKSRTIYQALTDRFARDTDDMKPCGNLKKYCGGNYRGLIKKLDYIKGMGFDAIWISPIVHQWYNSSATMDAYHGYWQDDLSRLNEHFGDDNDLINLVNAAHAKGIWIMVDFVANHMFHDFISRIVPFNKPEHYHSCSVCPKSCTIEDWNNQQQVEDCRLSNLPDLNQTVPVVRNYLKNWIKQTVQKYKIDGIRIDTIVEVPKWFWAEFVQASGVYAVGEANSPGLDYVSSYQPALPGLLSFPLFHAMRDAFAYGKSMYNLKNMVDAYPKKFRDVDALGTFIDCHDQPRFRSQNNDINMYKNAIVFTLMSPGIPIIYYGTEQYFDGGAEPWNREDLWRSKFNQQSELYKFIALVNKARIQNKVWREPQIERYVDEKFFAFTRGNTEKSVLIVTTNGGSQYAAKRQITYHPYKEGQQLCNIFWGQMDCISVWQGKLEVNLNGGEAKIYVPK